MRTVSCRDTDSGARPLGKGKRPKPGLALEDALAQLQAPAPAPSPMSSVHELQVEQLAVLFPGADRRVVKDIFDSVGRDVGAAVGLLQSMLGATSRTWGWGGAGIARHGIRARGGASSLVPDGASVSYGRVAGGSRGVTFKIAGGGSGSAGSLPARMGVSPSSPIGHCELSPMRESSEKLRVLQASMYDKAQALFTRGRKAEAGVVASRAQKLKLKIRDAEQHECQDIFRRNNLKWVGDPFVIDLHGLFVREALQAVRTRIWDLESCPVGRLPAPWKNHLTVVTGAGLHSKGGVARSVCIPVLIRIHQHLD
jgi:hypothetical protein